MYCVKDAMENDKEYRYIAHDSMKSVELNVRNGRYESQWGVFQSKEDTQRHVRSSHPTEILATTRKLQRMHSKSPSKSGSHVINLMEGKIGGRESDVGDQVDAEQKNESE